MADGLLCSSQVLRNGYRSKVFRRTTGVERSSNLIFVGRLVSSKGADLVIHILAQLRREGIDVELTVVGDGPCRAPLYNSAQQLGVAEAVHFVGNQPSAAVARLLNEHRILVAPSRITETFGLVALEALACGCVPVVADVGGLPETVGKHGVVVREGDLVGFVDAVRRLLHDDNVLNRKLEGAEQHVEQFLEERVVADYAQAIERAYCKRRRVSDWASAIVPILGLTPDLSHVPF